VLIVAAVDKQGLANWLLADSQSAYQLPAEYTESLKLGSINQLMY